MSVNNNRLSFGNIANNNTISSEDVKAGIKISDFDNDVHKSIFTKMFDENGDGTLSVEEKDAIMQKLAETAKIDGNEDNLSEDEAKELLNEFKLKGISTEDLFSFFEKVKEISANIVENIKENEDIKEIDKDSTFKEKMDNLASNTVNIAKTIFNSITEAFNNDNTEDTVSSNEVIDEEQNNLETIEPSDTEVDSTEDIDTEEENIEIEDVEIEDNALDPDDVDIDEPDDLFEEDKEDDEEIEETEDSSVVSTEMDDSEDNPDKTADVIAEHKAEVGKPSPFHKGFTVTNVNKDGSFFERQDEKNPDGTLLEYKCSQQGKILDKQFIR